ncbi:hypothetical protein Bamb_0746 [Burkholderia ambifaria AMMD]|uniref:Uncharacterized protein n=1 Tax=Burkholderia ambifaria (strain ATCC BAA-244 / DSM 16087 / CCUG 44356 / LMG 19182 / AMMD) TaxID=339670 RepID=Q0BHR8_BURCM|nr:hypothetical protein Bamb_0746 [Burkholderia ambifaria AMMD]
MRRRRRFFTYFDEDKIDASGVRHDPYFECAWDSRLFHSQSMFCRLGALHKRFAEKGRISCRLRRFAGLRLCIARHRATRCRRHPSTVFGA